MRTPSLGEKFKHLYRGTVYENEGNRNLRKTDGTLWTKSELSTQEVSFPSVEWSESVEGRLSKLAETWARYSGQRIVKEMPCEVIWCWKVCVGIPASRNRSKGKWSRKWMEMWHFWSRTKAKQWVSSSFKKVTNVEIGNQQKIFMLYQRELKD